MSGDFLSKNLSISAWKTNITMLNGSYHTDTHCNIKIQAMNFLSIIISLVGMGLNAIVLWFLGIHMHRNAFSVYILNLAMADFLFLCSQFVFCLLDAIYFFYYILTEITIFFFYIVRIFAYLSGLSILSAISIERCLSIIWPIWYHCHRSKHTSAITCFVLWAMSLLFALLEGKACGLLFSSFDFYWCETFDVITSVWSIVLFVVLCGSSLTLLIRIFCGSQRIPVTRLYVTIAFTVLVFLIFGLPFGIYWLLYQWVSDFHYVRHCDFFHEIQFLSCVNSCANPIIYFLVGSIRHRRFRRKTLKLLLQRAMQDIPEEEDCVDNNPSEHPEELERVQSRS